MHACLDDDACMDGRAGMMQAAFLKTKICLGVSLTSCAPDQPRVPPFRAYMTATRSSFDT